MCSQSWKSLWVYFRYTHSCSATVILLQSGYILYLFFLHLFLCVCVCVYELSCFIYVQLFAMPCTITHQAPLSMGFSQREYWSGLSCPPPGDVPNWGIEPASSVSPALQAHSFTAEPLGKPCLFLGLSKPPSTETAQWAFNQCQSDTSMLLLKCSQVLLVAVEYEWSSFVICSADLFSYHCVLCTYCPECLLKNLWLGFFLTSGPQGDLPGHSISITLSPRVIFYCSTWFVFFKSLITLWNYSFICCLNLYISLG